MSNDKVFEPHEIDYSAITPPTTLDPSSENWEPPPHVFYGKRLPNGKSEKEPAYVYQEYPRMLYGMIEGRIRARIVNSDDEKKALLDQGYGLGPADFGVETLPGREVQIERDIERELVTPKLETETVQIVKRKPGRPRKE